MKKILFALALVAVLSAAPSAASAATYYYDDATSDESWDTAGNWWTDAGHTVAAGVTPSAGDTVYIDGAINGGPSSPLALTLIRVAYATTTSIEVDLSGASGTFEFYHYALNGGDLAGDVAWNDDSRNYGYIANGRTVVFNDDSLNVRPINGTVTFNDSSLNASNAGITGTITFNDSSANYTVGVVNGDATFNDSSQNQGSVTGDATFNDSSHAQLSTISGDAVFNDSSYSNGSTVLGNAIFNHASYNDGNVTSDAVFNDTSYNGGTVDGAATFNGSAHNDDAVNGDATFNDSADNAGNVLGDALFACTATNSGTVAGNTTQVACFDAPGPRRSSGRRSQSGDSRPAAKSATTTTAVALRVSPSLSATRDLQVGASGEDVRALQRFLNAAGFTVAESGAGSAGGESDYFGELTRQALARWQLARGVAPAAGYYGPVTRAAMVAVR